ncbi:MAG: MOSC domain-containing protein [Pirellulaceae bacterium]
MPTILSINVGRVAVHTDDRAADGNDRRWTTAFFKTPVAGPVAAGSLGLAGDQQANQIHHGGLDKAALAYSVDHYPFWQAHLGIPDMPLGGFGENLLIAGVDENSVCIGDVWRAGDAKLQVSQPRQPCWKMSRRWRIQDLAQQVVANGKSGWYLRVLVGGTISAGSEMELIERPYPAWTVARASQVMHHRQNDLTLAAELAALPELSASWKATLK